LASKIQGEKKETHDFSLVTLAINAYREFQGTESSLSLNTGSKASILLFLTLFSAISNTGGVIWVCIHVYGSGTDRQAQPVPGILTSKSTFSPSGILGAVSLQRVKNKNKKKKKGF